ncbi:MAG: B12-binding domain-containing radical SAM protein [Candidatus Binatia bacterium]
MKKLKVLLVRARSFQIGNLEHPHHIYPPLTLKYIEALLKAKGGYHVKLWDCWPDPRPLEGLVTDTLSWSPDLLVVLSNPVDAEMAFQYASGVKAGGPKALILGIGPEATLNPEKFLRANFPFDAALLGEAELETVSLAERLRRGVGPEEARTHYLRPLQGKSEPLLIADLDALPFPTHSLEELRTYRFIYPLRMKKRALWGFILSSRGCPNPCIFCSPIIRKSYGRKVRTRSAANVSDEIEHLMKLGVTIISFEDDNLTADHRRLLTLCREIRERSLNISWIAHARVDELTPELLRTMREAGCVLLRLGVESGSERVIRLLKKDRQAEASRSKRTSGKEAARGNLGEHSSINGWKQKCMMAFREARRAGIATNALFILGSPGETREEMEATIRLAHELRPDMIQAHFFTLYPGSAAYEMFRGRIPPEEISTLHHYQITANLSAVSSQELRQIRSRFYKSFLSRPSFLLEHLYRYGFFYLRNRTVLRRLWQITKVI